MNGLFQDIFKGLNDENNLYFFTDRDFAAFVDCCSDGVRAISTKLRSNCRWYTDK